MHECARKSYVHSKGVKGAEWDEMYCDPISRFVGKVILDSINLGISEFEWLFFYSV